jgi:hypothetical protein
MAAYTPFKARTDASEPFAAKRHRDAEVARLERLAPLVTQVAPP